jgi:hypothetical protein
MMMTVRGAFPSTAKLAVSVGSAEIVARPFLSLALLTPHPGPRTMLWNHREATVPHFGVHSVAAPDMDLPTCESSPVKEVMLNKM